MFPGSTTKLSESTLASAATISPKTDIVLLTGTTAVNNIVPAYGGGFSGILFLVATNAAGVVLGTTGNILVGITATQNRVVVLTFVRSLGKWVIGL